MAINRIGRTTIPDKAMSLLLDLLILERWRTVARSWTAVLGRGEISPSGCCARYRRPDTPKRPVRSRPALPTGSFGSPIISSIQV